MRNLYSMEVNAIKLGIITCIVFLCIFTTNAQEKDICINVTKHTSISFFDGIEQIIDDIPYTIGYASASKILKEVTINKTICKKSVVELLEQVLEGKNLRIIEEGDFITIEKTPKKKQTKTGTISGFVYEEKDAKFSPIIDVEVYLYEGKGSQIFIEATKTTNTGQYTFKNLKPGEYLIKLQSNEDYTSANDIYISLEEGKNAKVNNIVIKQFQISPVSLDCVDKINDQATELSWSTDKTDCATFISYNIYASSNRISDYNQIAQIKDANKTDYVDSISNNINNSPVFYYIVQNCNGTLSAPSDTLDNENPTFSLIDYVSIENEKVEIKLNKNTSNRVNPYAINYLADTGFVSIDTIKNTNLPYIHHINISQLNAKPQHYSVTPISFCKTENQNNLTSETVFLKAFNDDCNDEILLSWTPYLGWTEKLNRYEIYVSYEGDSFIKIDTTEFDIRTYSFKTDSIKATELCFSIKAVRSGDLLRSNSNNVCISIVDIENSTNAKQVKEKTNEYVNMRLNAFNLRPGYISINSGKNRLTEGLSYTANYSLGTIKLKKDLFVDSKKPISISYNSNIFNNDKKMPNSIKFSRISNTKEKSLLLYETDVTQFIPRRLSKTIDKVEQVFIDDFENIFTYNTFNYETSWTLASTPFGAQGKNGNLLFPEAERINDLSYGYNRAKINWYKLDYIYWDSIKRITNYEEKQIALNSHTFNISYYPGERGPYNYTTNLNIDGTLPKPKNSWGGIMQPVRSWNFSTDFGPSTTAYIEFWMMDPFIENPENSGSLYINLGEISEDILKDSKKFGEYCIGVGNNVPLDTTKWGITSLNEISTTSYLSKDVNERIKQDVGLDGANDNLERILFRSYLDKIKDSRIESGVKDAILNDPSNDNYNHFSLEAEMTDKTKISDAYKKINNPEGNSISKKYDIADKEDINRDDTLNCSETYFEYRIDLRANLKPGDIPYLSNVVYKDAVRWLNFKIPFDDYTNKIGSIADFRSIRFIRMFLTGFNEPITCRFKRFDLVKNQWKKHSGSLRLPMEKLISNTENTFFTVTAVGRDTYMERRGIDYIEPPNYSYAGKRYHPSDQSMSVEVRNLEDGDARAVFKTLNFDFREFKRIKMSLHARTSMHSLDEVEDGEVTAFIRISSDFAKNFYEYEIPLAIRTKEEVKRKIIGEFMTGDSVRRKLYESDWDRIIWPESNEVDFFIDSLVKVKENRDLANWESTCLYTEKKLERLSTKGDSLFRNISVLGSPDISNIKTIMLGVRNPLQNSTFNPLVTADDGESKSIEVWFNELALADFNKSEQFETLFTMNKHKTFLSRYTYRVALIQSYKRK